MANFLMLLRLVKFALEALAVLALSALSVTIVRGILSRYAKARVLRDIPGPTPTSFATGNFRELYSADGALYSSLITYGGVTKVYGLFGDVLLAVSDPRALTHILVKDVSNYVAFDFSATLGLFGGGLLATNGAAHRQQRKLLNPSFAPSYIRRLTPLVHAISRELRDAIAKEVSEGGAGRSHELDVAEWFSRAGLEMIARAGFGHSFQALKGEGDAFAKAVKAISPTFMKLGALISFFIMSGAAGMPSRVLRGMGGAAALAFPAYRDMVDIISTLRTESYAVWKVRRAERDSVGSVGDGEELLSVLLEESGKGRVSDEILIANTTTLVVAGTDTTSTALARILHLLTLQPDVQNKLRDELVRAHAASAEESDELSYEALSELPFLDAVCRETLRLFAPLPFRNRRSLVDTIVPLADGTSVHIPADTEILVNIHCLNTDESIWGSDAHQWRPERWLDPLPESVLNTKIPGVWGGALTFGAGPKGCIGFSFSILEMKSILATLLPAFRFSLPAEREIEWRFGPIVVPGVKGEQSVNPRMPLVVKTLA